MIPRNHHSPTHCAREGWQVFKFWKWYERVWVDEVLTAVMFIIWSFLFLLFLLLGMSFLASRSSLSLASIRVVQVVFLPPEPI